MPDQDYAALVRRRNPRVPCGRANWSSPTARSSADMKDISISRSASERAWASRLGGRFTSWISIPLPIASRSATSRSCATALVAAEVNWLSDRPAPARQPIPCPAKIRYNHDPQPATVIVERTARSSCDSTSRRRPSRRGRPWCCMMATSFWAADGSKERCD